MLQKTNDGYRIVPEEITDETELENYPLQNVELDIDMEKLTYVLIDFINSYGGVDMTKLENYHLANKLGTILVTNVFHETLMKWEENGKA